jgi:hypothetical protein
MVFLFLVVKELHFALLHVRWQKGIAGTIGAVQDRAANHVTHFAAVKGLAFARLGKLKIYDHKRIIIDLNFYSFSQITGSVHFLILFFLSDFRSAQGALILECPFIIYLIRIVKRVILDRLQLRGHFLAVFAWFLKKTCEKSD